MILRALAIVVLAFTPVSFAAPAFQLNDLVGAWEHGLNYTELPDGSHFEQFPGQRGMLVILPDGRYIHGVIGADLPKVASGNIKEQTTEEAKALAGGTLLHFGTWTANPDKGTFTVKIERSSFPNFDGRDQVRQVLSLDKQRLEYINHLSSAGDGAKVYVELHRIGK